MKRLPPAVLPILGLLAFVAAGAVSRLTDVRSRSATAPLAAPSSELGGRFSLTDQYGKPRTDRDFRGKFMLVFFGYTYCPDVCPTTLAVEAEALDDLGPRASRIAPIFISLDPRRD